jgi:hypothetical protein
MAITWFDRPISQDLITHTHDETCNIPFWNFSSGTPIARFCPVAENPFRTLRLKCSKLTEFS